MLAVGMKVRQNAADQPLKTLDSAREFRLTGAQQDFKDFDHIGA